MSIIKGKKGLTSRLFPDAGRIMTKQWQLHVEGLAFSFSCVSYFHEKWEEMVLKVSQVGDWRDRYICIDKFLCLTHPCVYLRWKKRLQINYKCNQSGFFWEMLVWVAGKKLILLFFGFCVVPTSVVRSIFKHRHEWLKTALHFCYSYRFALLSVWSKEAAEHEGCAFCRWTCRG